nr:hypothetical protein [Mucilaginibacter sp. X4EP1]
MAGVNLHDGKFSNKKTGLVYKGRPILIVCLG